jgi:hypothetical protein
MTGEPITLNRSKGLRTSNTLIGPNLREAEGLGP